LARNEITTSLQLKQALIAFHRLRGSHDGKSMAQAAIQMLDRAGITANASDQNSTSTQLSIDKNISGGTLDNAANNRTFMDEFGKILEARDLTFDAVDGQIMCFPHTINICCHHVIDDFTNIDLADEDQDILANLADLPEAARDQTFEEAIARDPIARGRNIV
jgi:hypothetical protein